MKKVIHKCFWVWQFEQEEQWLNQMAAQGLNLTDMSLGRYVFEEGLPGEYQYRLEMLENMPTAATSQQYLAFLEETGVEYIGSLLRWVYLRKKTAAGPFDLFSDLDSRLKHLRRINTLLLVLIPPCLFLGVYNICLGVRFSPLSIVNLVIGLLLVALCSLIGWGIHLITGKIRRLQQERVVRE